MTIATKRIHQAYGVAIIALVVGFYFVLKNEHDSTAVMARSAAIAELRGASVKCFEATPADAEVAEKCVLNMIDAKQRDTMLNRIVKTGV